MMVSENGTGSPHFSVWAAGHVTHLTPRNSNLRFGHLFPKSVAITSAHIPRGIREGQRVPFRFLPLDSS